MLEENEVSKKARGDLLGPGDARDKRVGLTREGASPRRVSSKAILPPATS
jgi:hypothetical protein